MLDFADIVAINKFDRKGAEDALRDVRKQVQRNRQAFGAGAEQMPVFGTIASRFNDDGVTALYHAVAARLAEKGLKLKPGRLPRLDAKVPSDVHVIIPPKRQRYLAEIAETVRAYHQFASEQSRIARERQQLAATRAMLGKELPEIQSLLAQRSLDADAKALLDSWPETLKTYSGDEHVVKVRGKEIRTALGSASLSGTRVPKVALPKFEDHGELLRWRLRENLPGEFPFTAGVFHFKRENEDPTRMFAGEGSPFRTNRRFHLLSKDLPAKRLSTAFDSVTLYGFDPDERPDIYGKVGNSGVSIATLDDMEVLYSGFDLCDPATSVSISGYHIAEVGANPVSQLAFTLANGFTFVEAYLARGMHIDDFAPNLSFFFSYGMDPEYAVLGRVARRIWAVAMKRRYGGNERSQKLKFHSQTSGRSLHAQEIAFNDIRTTLQALISTYDNTNSLHTNAYDEAITTPTEESVRRAMAIQMIINREWGVAKNENPNQGSFVLEELTDLVEEAVLKEFEAISSRGGVLGAMETGYQRGKIQEESLYYEHRKHDGSYPIIGVNSFRNPHGDSTPQKLELIRSTEEEKQSQLKRLREFQRTNASASGDMLERLRKAVIENQNVFAVLMDAVRVCSLGQITHALFEVGGQYRRSM